MDRIFLIAAVTGMVCGTTKCATRYSSYGRSICLGFLPRPGIHPMSELF